MPDAMDPATRKTLRQAFANRRLTLYLGAGVSVGSGLPTWDKLVLALYFATVSDRRLPGWRPFPNYLYAIADWYLGSRQEPLEITARKLKAMFDETSPYDESFGNALRNALYGLQTESLEIQEPVPLEGNATLMAVRDLCLAKPRGRYGVRSIITYNYDDLVERSIEETGTRQVQPIWDKTRAKRNALPVYHVHGYLPFRADPSEDEHGLVFSEEEYNQTATDPYHWSNIVQLSEMSNTVGVMVGLSLADRNIRRLLDALKEAPVRPELYALMREPERIELSDGVVDDINAKAVELYKDFESSGVRNWGDAETVGFSHGPSVKSSHHYARDIRGITSAVDDVDKSMDEAVLAALGITPIWYDSHDKIPAILEEIYNA